MLASLWLGSLHIIGIWTILQNELPMPNAFPERITESRSYAVRRPWLWSLDDDPPKKSPNTWFIKEFEHIIHHQNLEMTGVCNKWSGTIRACIWNQWQSSSCSSCKWECCWVHIAIGTVPGREKYKSCLISGLTMVPGRYNELVFMGVIMVYKSRKTDLQITKEIRVKRHPWSWTQTRAVGNCCFMLRHDWMHVAFLRFLILALL